MYTRLGCNSNRKDNAFAVGPYGTHDVFQARQQALMDTMLCFANVLIDSFIFMAFRSQQ